MKRIDSLSGIAKTVTGKDQLMKELILEFDKLEEVTRREREG